MQCPTDVRDLAPRPQRRLILVAAAELSGCVTAAALSSCLWPLRCGEACWLRATGCSTWADICQIVALTCADLHFPPALLLPLLYSVLRGLGDELDFAKVYAVHGRAAGLAFKGEKQLFAGDVAASAKLADALKQSSKDESKRASAEKRSRGASNRQLPNKRRAYGNSGFNQPTLYVPQGMMPSAMVPQGMVPLMWDPQLMAQSMFAQQAQQPAQEVCFRCHKPGHRASECYAKVPRQSGNTFQALKPAF